MASDSTKPPGPFSTFYALAGGFWLVNQIVQTSLIPHIWPKPEKHFENAYRSIFILSSVIGLLPWLACWLVLVGAYAWMPRRRTWGLVGAVVGLAVSLIYKPDREALPVILRAWCPESKASWICAMTVVGFSFGVSISGTQMARRFDSRLESLPVADEIESTEEGKTTALSALPLLLTFLSAFGMLWTLAAGLDNFSERVLPLIATPAAERQKSDMWILGIVVFFGLWIYLPSVFYFYRSTNFSIWCTFCAFVSGAICWSTLRFAVGQDTWQDQWFHTYLTVYAMHFGNFAGWICRGKPISRRFHKALGLEHLLNFKQTSIEAKEKPATLVDVAFGHEKKQTV